MVSFLKTEHVEIMEECRNREEVIRILGDRLIRTGTVRRDYIDGVLERERKHPTGLFLEGGIHAAIPHADPEGVLRTGLALGIIKKGVSFREMADKDKKISVRLVFLLAPRGSEEQLTFLQQTMELLQRKDIREKLLHSERRDEVVRILSEVFQLSRGESP